MAYKLIRNMSKSGKGRASCDVIREAQQTQHYKALRYNENVSEAVHFREQKQQGHQV